MEGSNTRLINYVRFKGFTAVTMKNGVFTDSCHPDDGVAKFLENVVPYKSHTA
jgi:hypothetical protein